MPDVRILPRETWLHSLPHAEADLIREGDAAQEMSKHYSRRNEFDKAAHWDRVATACYDERRKLAEARTTA